MSEKRLSFILLALAVSLLASTWARIPVLDSKPALSPTHSEVSPNKGQAMAFFPVAVWYSGGKARAPMLETITPDAPRGRWVFFFNHADKPASVEFGRAVEKPASSIREIMTGQDVAPEGAELNLKTDVPPQSVRVYRIEF